MGKEERETEVWPSGPDKGRGQQWRDGSSSWLDERKSMCEMSFSGLMHICFDADFFNFILVHHFLS